MTGYFDRFLAAFPTIEALAAADEHDVLRLWEGLGYYRRARQLHRAAKLIVAEHGGKFPADAEVVRRLPGIGRYTAGAILSIAFDAREPILEANTLRLLSRLLAFDGDPRSTEGQRLLWAMAEAVLPSAGSGRMNQALMELGSEICTASGAAVRGLSRRHALPREPAGPATRNPAAEGKAFDRGGAPSGRARASAWPGVAAALAGRPPVCRIMGFPAISHRSRNGRPTLRRELAENVLALTGVVVVPGRHVKTLTHGVTRFRITLECYEAEFLSSLLKKGTGSERNDADSAERRGVRGACPLFQQAVSVSGRANESCRLQTRWLRPTELEAYPLSSTGRKLAKLIRSA